MSLNSVSAPINPIPKHSAPADADADLNLRFDFGAIDALQSKGINLLEGLKPEILKDPKSYTHLVWAGRLHLRPETPAEAQEEDAWATLRTMRPRSVIRQITAALKDALGKEDGTVSEESVNASSGEGKQEAQPSS